MDSAGTATPAGRPSGPNEAAEVIWKHGGSGIGSAPSSQVMVEAGTSAFAERPSATSALVA